MEAVVEVASLVAPKSIALPSVTDFLTESQWNVLLGIMDTIAPAIQPQGETAKSISTDALAVHLPIAQYADATTQIRQAASPADVSTELIEAYLTEKPSENPVFTDVLKVILSNLPPSKKRELGYLLSILR